MVSIARSRDEIERLLVRHAATGFLYGEQGEQAMIAFELEGRRYRMMLRYPDVESIEVRRNQYTRSQSDAQRIRAAYEQEKQRLWRGLALLVKAKLEAVASGISTLEEEMLYYTVMPDGETVGEWLEPQIREVYRSGKMPPLLPGVKGNQKQIAGPSDYIEGGVTS